MNQTRCFALLLSIVLCIPLAATAAAAEQRIVSLAPSITASLYELGAETAVIGITLHCPAGTSKKTVIGTLWEPNIEKILSLKPDLVICTKEGNRKEDAHRLTELGVPVYVVEADQDFDGICTNFVALGKRIGREDRARGIVSSMQAKIADIHTSVQKEKPLRVFWEVGARPLYTISRASFVNDFNTYVGSINIFGTLASRYPQISREEVVARDPDVILLVAMGDVTAAEQTYWSGFPTLAAARDNRIFVLDAASIFTPTPVTFANGVELIARLLHPAVFSETLPHRKDHRP